MKRIKMMFMAMVAVLAIGAVGASAASAAVGDGEATITLAGSGSCDVTFERDAWSGTGTTWSSDIHDIAVDTGGDCAVDAASGSGTFTKHSDGSAEFSSSPTFTLTVYFLGFPIQCTYSGSASGSWFWTVHNGTTPVAAPPGGPGEDKYFTMTGTATLVSGTVVSQCPGYASPGPYPPQSLSMTARTHEVS